MTRSDLDGYCSMTESKIHLVGKDKAPCQCAWCMRTKEPEVVMAEQQYAVDANGSPLEEACS